MRPFTTIAVGVFALVAAGHALRLLLGWKVLVNDSVIPPWVSAVSLAVAGTLAVLVWRESSATGGTQRKTRRTEALLLTTYTVRQKDGGESEVAFGRTLDVSDRGVMVETQERLKLGTELDLEIALGERLIQTKGTVVHVEEAANDLFATGIQVDKYLRE